MSHKPNFESPPLLPYFVPDRIRPRSRKSYSAGSSGSNCSDEENTSSRGPTPNHPRIITPRSLLSTPRSSTPEVPSDLGVTHSDGLSDKERAVRKVMKQISREKIFDVS